MRKSGANPVQPRYCNHDEITLSHCKTTCFVGRRESRMTESQDTIHGFEKFSYEGMEAHFLFPFIVDFMFYFNSCIIIGGAGAD